jgi:hypothetical protein
MASHHSTVIKTEDKWRVNCTFHFFIRPHLQKTQRFSFLIRCICTQTQAQHIMRRYDQVRFEKLVQVQHIVNLCYVNGELNPNVFCKRYQTRYWKVQFTNKHEQN